MEKDINEENKASITKDTKIKDNITKEKKINKKKNRSNISYSFFIIICKH